MEEERICKQEILQAMKKKKEAWRGEACGHFKFEYLGYRDHLKLKGEKKEKQGDEIYKNLQHSFP